MSGNCENVSEIQNINLVGECINFCPPAVMLQFPVKMNVVSVAEILEVKLSTQRRCYAPRK